MEEYFNIRYEFDRDKVDSAIERQMHDDHSDYICVSDGVVLANTTKDPKYKEVVNGGLFSICDSSYVPFYLKILYGIRRGQYTGHQLFLHIVGQKKYKMMFLGTSERILLPLKAKLEEMDPAIGEMKFIELPFAEAEGFDYEQIGKMINEERPDIVWVALGAPKQEKFMYYLKPYVKHGVMISVGAVFKFVSGVEARRAPQWMIDHRMEFIHRIIFEPRKQIKRCVAIMKALPGVLLEEYRRKNSKHPS